MISTRRGFIQACHAETADAGISVLSDPDLRCSNISIPMAIAAAEPLRCRALESGCKILHQQAASAAVSTK